MIRYTKDNPKMIRRRSEIEHKKTAPGKGGIRCEIQSIFSSRCSFFAYKKGGPGISPWHNSRALRIYLKKVTAFV